MAKSDIDLVMARTDPSKVFNNPIDIAKDQKLSIAQKLELLSIWECDAQLLQQATHEGMDKGEPNLLQKVHEAIQIIKDETSKN